MLLWFTLLNVDEDFTVCFFQIEISLIKNLHKISQQLEMNVNKTMNWVNAKILHRFLMILQNVWNILLK